MNKTKFKGVVFLFITSFIWGISFVSQSVGMEKIEGFTFNGIRMLMGALVLIPVIILREKKVKSLIDKKTLIYGSIMGVVFFIASNLQQQAFRYTGPGKIAFITSIYIFFVPLFGIYLKKKVSLYTWVSILIGAVGLYLLCIDPKELNSINIGDVLTLLCAAAFAIHILLIEKYGSGLDGVKLSFVQFTVAGLMSCGIMFIFENPEITMIKSAGIPLLYSGVLSCGVAYTFQIIGQKYTEATVASLIMCMESVFAVIASAIILHDFMSLREIIGCVIMLSAIIFSQVAEKMFEKEAEIEYNN